MKKFVSPVFLTAVAAFALSAVAHAGVVYTPAGSGQATGSAYFDFQNSFDAPPNLAQLVNNQAVFPDVSQLGSNPTRYAQAQGYIDFGAGFSSIQIDGLWTAYRNYSDVSTAVPLTDLWWSDTINNVRGATGTFTDINPATFNFGTKPIASNNSVVWTQDYDLSGAPVAVQRRYLIVSAPSNWGGGDRITELAITTVVPEPGTAALLGLGLTSCLLLRRRTKLSLM